MRTLAPLILALALGMAGEPPHGAAAKEAKDLVAREGAAGLSWRELRRTDMNCDGLPDHVLISSDEGHFYVGIVIAPAADKAQVSIVQFALRGDSQASFCGPFQSLAEEGLATPEEMKEMVGGVPSGYRYSPGCKGLRLVAGECDSFHLFWDHERKRLAWWRL